MTHSDAQARTWPLILGALSAGHDLDVADAEWAMNEIMSDSATSAQIAAFGVALKIKGPVSAELRGLAAGMLSHSTVVPTSVPCIDIVGTGGDRSNTVNISTMTAVVVAAAGVPVVKHGNRAASSKSGGADVLEALGVKISLTADGVARCVEQLGIGFCFAPVFHPALRFTAAARKEIGIPTVFNVLGPLTNPAQPSSGLVGCAFADLAPVLAQIFAERGHSVLVVRGDDGLDELTTTATSTVWQVAGGTVRRQVVDPTTIGLARVELSALQGADAEYNARVAHELFSGMTGPVRDAVLLNAAGALTAYRPRPDIDLHIQLREQLTVAAAAIDSGAATALLADWVRLSNSL
ncbi:anthranilate phosphoribosyltransferase [Williamsia soli]|uniref:anthranilate phosphoribosyltransferase n=1 Tax=Williamsia soli TaxID=364929 RepID=UPI0027DB9040|nr:anthranilate phosphoribosyltransferase [Williamsia soli]